MAALPFSLVVLQLFGLFFGLQPVAGGVVEITLTTGYLINARPDGVNYTMLAFNGTVPGPKIEVSEGDRVVIRVQNLLLEETSLHIHGLTQRDSALHDGVPWVTQCPIAPGETFVYTWVADAAGTHWYHSHSGHQRGEGLFGALVVQSAKDPYAQAYQGEHVLIVQDWYHHSLHRIFQSYVGALPPRIGEPFLTGPRIPPADVAGGIFFRNGMLCNGVAKFDCALLPAQRPEPGTTCDASAGQWAEFDVQRGSAYRFRIIGASVALEFTLSIDSHTFSVIGTDGAAVQQSGPLSSLVISSGETYDILVNANQHLGRYWIRACVPWLDCTVNVTDPVSGVSSPVPTSYPLAILHYAGAERRDPTSAHTPGETLDLMSLAPRPETSSVPRNPHWTVFESGSEWEMNGTQYADQRVPLAMRLPSDDDGLYPVTVPIYSFPVGQGAGQAATSAVLLVFNNLTPFTHPMHLHGHLGWLVGLGEYGDGAFNPTRDGAKLRLDRAIRKHTVNVQGRSWAALLYAVDNPGYWLFHCHIDFHMMVGMAVVLHDSDGAHHPVPADFPQWCLPQTNRAGTLLWRLVLICTSVVVLVLAALICIRKRRIAHRLRASHKLPHVPSSGLGLSSTSDHAPLISV